MNKNALIALVAVIALALVGFGAYAFITAPTKAPSQPSGQQKPAQKPLAPVTTTTAAEVAPTQNQTRYAIVSESSVATFTLDEMLRGEPKTVVGTSTGYIAGEFALDGENPASSTMGEIRINARTFVTDDNSRNNMVRRAILKTEDDANEFITFKPTSIILVPTNEQPIDSLIFTVDILGDLTIAGVTKPVVFRAKVDVGMDGRLIALATTTVKRSDFNLVIPSIPFIANVEENVDISLDFIAKPVTE